MWVRLLVGDTRCNPVVLAQGGLRLTSPEGFLYEDAALAAETAAAMVSKSLSWTGVCDPQQTGSQKILLLPHCLSVGTGQGKGTCALRAGLRASRDCIFCTLNGSIEP